MKTQTQRIWYRLHRLSSSGLWMPLSPRNWNPLDAIASARNSRWKKLHRLSVAGLLISISPHGWALDVDQGDYTPLNPGQNLARIYYNHINADSAYSQGRPVKDSHESQDASILRVIHFMKLGPFTIDPQFLLPFGHVSARQAGQNLGHANGIGDLILANTFWFVNRPESGTYFGLTPMITLPTGDYNHNKSLNMGQHRYQFTLQAGFSQRITDYLTMDLIFDGTHYTHNHKFGSDSQTMNQRTLYQGQAFLKYNLTQRLDFRVSYSRLWGGREFVDNEQYSNQPDEKKYTLGMAYMFPSNTQIIATWGKDTSVHNGYKQTNNIGIRISQIF